VRLGKGFKGIEQCNPHGTGYPYGLQVRPQGSVVNHGHAKDSFLKGFSTNIFNSRLLPRARSITTLLSEGRAESLRRSWFLLHDAPKGRALGPLHRLVHRPMLLGTDQFARIQAPDKTSGMGHLLQDPRDMEVLANAVQLALPSGMQSRAGHVERL
jgi:hypothetical protein